MEIDWLTTAAQFINFLVLVWLLQHFLYRPIRKAITTRRNEIAAAGADAEARRAAGVKAEADYKGKLQDLENSRSALIERAHADADRLHAELSAKLERDIQHQRLEMKNALQAERAEFLTRIRDTSADVIVEIAGRVLEDLATVSFERQMIERLIANIGQAEAPFEALHTGHGPIEATLRTRFTPLSNDKSGNGESGNGEQGMLDDLLQDLSKALAERIGAPVKLAHRADPEGPIGAVLEIGDVTIGWTLDAYLDRMRHTLSNLMDERLGHEEPPA